MRFSERAKVVPFIKNLLPKIEYFGVTAPFTKTDPVPFAKTDPVPFAEALK